MAGSRSKSRRLQGKVQADNHSRQPRGVQNHGPDESSSQPSAQHISDFQVRRAANVNLGETHAPMFFINISEQNMSELIFALSTRFVGGLTPELSYKNTGPDPSDVLFYYANSLAAEAHPGMHPNQRRGHRGSSPPLSHRQPDVATHSTQHGTQINGPVEDQETPDDQQLPLGGVDQSKLAEGKQRVKTGLTRNDLGQDQEEKKDWYQSLRPRNK